MRKPEFWSEDALEGRLGVDLFPEKQVRDLQNYVEHLEWALATAHKVFGHESDRVAGLVKSLNAELAALKGRAASQVLAGEKCRDCFGTGRVVPYVSAERAIDTRCPHGCPEVTTAVPAPAASVDLGKVKAALQSCDLHRHLLLQATGIEDDGSISEAVSEALALLSRAEKGE